MKMTVNLFHSILKTSFQAKRNRNRAALKNLTRLGYPLVNVRKALFHLNELKLQKMGNGDISIPTLYNTMRGSKGNRIAQEIIAKGLDLTREELFPDEG